MQIMRNKLCNLATCYLLYTLLSAAVGNAQEICCEDLMQEIIQFLNKNISSSAEFSDVFLCKNGEISGLNAIFFHGKSCQVKTESGIYRQTVNIGFKYLEVWCKMKFFTEIYYVFKKISPVLIVHSSWKDLKFKIKFDFIPGNRTKFVVPHQFYIHSVRIAGFHFGGLRLWYSGESRPYVFGIMCWILTYPSIIRYLLGLLTQVVLEFYFEDIIVNSDLSRGLFYLHCKYFW